jgi:hypothetical protein
MLSQVKPLMQHILTAGRTVRIPVIKDSFKFDYSAIYDSHKIVVSSVVPLSVNRSTTTIGLAWKIIDGYAIWIDDKQEFKEQTLVHEIVHVLLEHPGYTTKQRDTYFAYLAEWFAEYVSYIFCVANGIKVDPKSLEIIQFYEMHLTILQGHIHLGNQTALYIQERVKEI